MSTLLLAGQTDVGQRRRDNQDTFICIPLWSTTTVLLVVIDGVGGYAGGDQAAAIAKTSIERYMTTPTGDRLTMLREAVTYANNQIVEQRQQEPGLAQMCCVLTAAIADVQTKSLVFVHVGDTRLYRLRAGVLDKLTHDHSLVGIREDANQLTETEAMNHPRRNEILREVGSAVRRVDDPEFLEFGETDFQPGDGLLLCSDGLTDMLTRAQITSVLTGTLSPEEQVTELIRQANEQGGYDNITVVLAYNNSPDEAVITSVPPAKLEGMASSETTALPVSSLIPSNPPAAQPNSIPKKRLIRVGVLVAGIGLAGLSWQLLRQPDRPLPASDSTSRTEAGPVPTVVSADTATRVDTGRKAITITKSLPDSSRRP